MSSELKLCKEIMAEAEAQVNGKIRILEELNCSWLLNAKKVRRIREVMAQITMALLDFEEYQERFYCERHNLLAVCVVCNGLGCSTCEGEE